METSQTGEVLGIDALREINDANFCDIIDLSVSEEQAHLVLSNAVSIAQSKVQDKCIPLAVYSDDMPVGFLMYCVDRDDNEYWLYRLMIDQNQRKGYAKAAINLLLQRIQTDKDWHRLLLGVDTSGVASVKLYQSRGFAFDGQAFGKKPIMVLEY